MYLNIFYIKMYYVSAIGTADSWWILEFFIINYVKRIQIVQIK